MPENLPKIQSCPVLGEIKPPIFLHFPSKKDVLWYILVHQKTHENLNRNELSRNVIADTSTSIENIWLKTSLPFVCRLNIQRKISQFYDHYKKLRYLVKTGKLSKHEIEKFDFECNMLFDIIKCRCKCDKEICKCEINCPLKGNQCEKWTKFDTKLIKRNIFNANFYFKILKYIFMFKLLKSILFFQYIQYRPKEIFG